MIDLSALSGKNVAVVCVGNPLCSDDGFGPAVAARLQGKAVFDAGSVPENVLPQVARGEPDIVLFVDAGEFGAGPGTLRLVSPEELAQGSYGTHSASLDVAAEYLRQACRAQSMLLVAQPKSLALGGVMSVEMIRAVAEAAGLLREVV